MSAQRTRVAIVGAGFGQWGHARAFSRLPDCELVGISSVSAERAAAAGRAWNVPAFTDWRVMLDRCSADLLCVAAPPGAQRQVVEEAARRGLAVLCEKPMGACLDDAAAIVDAVKRGGAFGAVSFEFRYSSARRALRNLLRSCALGDIRAVNATELTDLLLRPRRTFAPWVYSQAEGGGLRGSHTVDALLDQIGAVTGVCALDAVFADPSPDRASEATAILLQFEGGALGTISASPFMGGSSRRLEIWGSVGSAVLEDERTLVMRDRAGAETVLHQGAEVDAIAHIEVCMEALARDVVAGMRGRPSQAPPLSQGLAVMQVLEASRRSAQGGRKEIVRGPTRTCS